MKLEDLEVRKKSMELTTQIYELTNKSVSFSKDFGLKDQIQRCAVSIASNISEGADRGTQKDFAKFLVYARGSCAEIRTQLTIARNLGYVKNEIFEKIHNEYISLHKMINAFLTSVKRNI